MIRASIFLALFACLALPIFADDGDLSATPVREQIPQFASAYAVLF